MQCKMAFCCAPHLLHKHIVNAVVWYPYCLHTCCSFKTCANCLPRCGGAKHLNVNGDLFSQRWRHNKANATLIAQPLNKTHTQFLKTLLLYVQTAQTGRHKCMQTHHQRHVPHICIAGFAACGMNWCTPGVSAAKPVNSNFSSDDAHVSQPC